MLRLIPGALLRLGVVLEVLVDNLAEGRRLRFLFDRGQTVGRLAAADADLLAWGFETDLANAENLRVMGLPASEWSPSWLMMKVTR
jgi:hypothetical protein